MVEAALLDAILVLSDARQALQRVREGDDFSIVISQFRETPILVAHGRDRDVIVGFDQFVVQLPSDSLNEFQKDVSIRV